MRRFISVVLALVAGFFLYNSNMLLYVESLQVESVKWITAAEYTGYGLIALFLSVLAVRFLNWLRITGVVFLSVGGFTAMVMGVVALVKFSPELASQVASRVGDKLNFFGDFLTGGIATGVLMLIGLLLVVFNNRFMKNQQLS